MAKNGLIVVKFLPECEKMMYAANAHIGSSSLKNANLDFQRSSPSPPCSNKRKESKKHDFRVLNLYKTI